MRGYCSAPEAYLATICRPDRAFLPYCPAESLCGSRESKNQPENMSRFLIFVIVVVFVFNQSLLSPKSSTPQDTSKALVRAEPADNTQADLPFSLPANLQTRKLRLFLRCATLSSALPWTETMSSVILQGEGREHIQIKS